MPAIFHCFRKKKNQEKKQQENQEEKKKMMEKRKAMTGIQSGVALADSSDSGDSSEDELGLGRWNARKWQDHD